MRHVRTALLLLLPALLIALAGCAPKSYFYSFALEQDLERNDGDWYKSSASYYFTPEGLSLDDCLITAPHCYTGDFDVTLAFKSFQAVEDGGAFSLILCSEKDPSESDWYAVIQIDDANKLDAYFSTYYYELGQQEIVDSSVAVSAPIYIDGVNTLRMLKKGDNIDFEFNDVKIGSTLVIGDGTVERFYTQIMNGPVAGGPPWVFTTFEITYSGKRYPIQ